MKHKKTSFIFSIIFLTTCYTFEGNNNTAVVETVTVNPHPHTSYLPPTHTPSFILHTQQPDANALNNYDAIACVTTTCGCAACCCVGPMSTPFVCELVRTGIMFAVAALAGKEKEPAVTITSYRDIIPKDPKK